MPERYLVAGDIRLDRADERLWKGDAPVKLGGKAFALVAALMARPKLLVSKDELFEAVWSGLAISESVLTTAVKEVRHALCDDARRPTIIETVHGRGYRFLLDVVETDELTPAVVEPGTSGNVDRARVLPARWRALAAVLLLLAVFGLGAVWWLQRDEADADRSAASAGPIAHAKSIAVLPFDDLSPGGDKAWFAAGLTGEVLNSLARTPDLRVASRTASERFGGEGADVVAAAKALNVAHVLEGSVRRDGERVRVNVQLIRADDGFQLWSEDYDRPDADVIGIQEDIAFEIARALKTAMDPAKLRAMVAAGTRSVEAYEAFLRSHALSAAHNRSGGIELSRQAGAEMERARTIDPNFARAHWEAAGEWFGRETRIDSYSSPTEAEETARLAKHLERIDAAIATAPNAADRLKYRAARAVMQLRFRETQRLLTQSLKLRPRDLDGWTELVDYSAYAANRKLTAIAAERVYTLSMEAGDPQSRAITATVMAGKFELAAERARRMMARLPDSAVVRYQAHRALLAAGDRDAARRLLPSIETADLPAGNRLLAALRQACADGLGAKAERIYRSINDLEDLSTRWVAAKTAGHHQTAAELLKPLDKPTRLPTLMQYMIYPDFDASIYPQLAASLARDGIRPVSHRRFPFACRGSG